MRIKGLGLLLSFFLLSCSIAGPAVNSSQDRLSDELLLRVPFFPQTEYQCGPSSLAEVYNYWGKRIAPEYIALELNSLSHKGVLTLDLYLHARAQGFNVIQKQGSIEELKGLIKDRVPVIVMVDRGVWVVQKNHFMVVVGYNSKGFIVHDGKEKNRYIPFDSFSEQWNKTGNWMLVVRP